MIPAAERLIEQAKNGERLNSTQRRHALAFILVTRPEGVEVTNEALGELFQVSSRTIRIDKNKIRSTRAQTVKEEDVGLVVADILIDYERTIRDLEASKNKCKLGTKERRSHNESIMKMRLDTVKALQELGFYPRNLGQMTVQKFEYKASVALDGAVTVNPVDQLPAPPRKALQEPPTIEGEFTSAPPVVEESAQEVGTCVT